MFGCISITKPIVIPPFETMKVKGNIRVKGHLMMVHVMVETSIRTYSDNVLTACAFVVVLRFMAPPAQALGLHNSILSL